MIYKQPAPSAPDSVACDVCGLYPLTQRLIFKHRHSTRCVRYAAHRALVDSGWRAAHYLDRKLVKLDFELRVENTGPNATPLKYGRTWVVYTLSSVYLTNMPRELQRLFLRHLREVVAPDPERQQQIIDVAHITSGDATKVAKLFDEVSIRTAHGAGGLLVAGPTSVAEWRQMPAHFTAFNGLNWLDGDDGWGFRPVTYKGVTRGDPRLGLP